MAAYRGLKAWEHARQLAVECSKTARRLPRVEQPSLGEELRQAAYMLVLRIAAGATGPSVDRRVALQQAQRALAEIDTILCIAYDLQYLPARDFARLEARADAAGKTLYGLLRKVEGITSWPAPTE